MCRLWKIVLSFGVVVLIWGNIGMGFFCLLGCDKSGCFVVCWLGWLFYFGGWLSGNLVY